MLRCGNPDTVVYTKNVIKMNQNLKRKFFHIILNKVAYLSQNWDRFHYAENRIQHEVV